MRAVLQRVRRARVLVDGVPVGEIGHGLVIFVGVGHDDGEAEAAWLAEKCAGLRIFEDESGKSNLSLLDVQGAALVISQFTLYADSRKGRRPSYVKAGPPELASPLVDKFAGFLAGWGAPVEKGVFGARMLVEIENDGPVTVILERDAKDRGG
jgi:D-tyrosyl-tRNA(Tyr) deacylase